jgi:hypothetical protein
MNKYLIVATDDRSYLDLKNVVIELKNKNLPYFFLYSNSNTRISPLSHLQEFSYDTNVDYNREKYLSKTLGFELPFKPNVLLITNENWEPEKSILWEFKQWGCFIGCIENSSWIYGGIKSKLELSSRKSFPTNCIDIFFDHSNWGKETKTISDWFSIKSIVTGNPRNDNFNFSTSEEKIMIVYGSLEKEHHTHILDIYKNLTKLEDWKIYYKPHPSEIKDFPNDFNNINLLRTYNEYFDVLSKSSYNIGIFSSVMYFPLVLNKKVVYIDAKTAGIEDELNIENYRGHEYDFWSEILGFKTFGEFKNFIGENFIKKIKKRNQDLERHINDNLVLYKKDFSFMGEKSNNKEVLKYFDEYNDNNASKRIINYIENEK